MLYQDTLPVDPEPDRVDIVFEEDYLYLNWAVPSIGPDREGTIGYRKGFEVTTLDDNNVINMNMSTEFGSFNDVQLNFTDAGHLYTVKLQTVSCSGLNRSVGYSFSQVSAPTTPGEDEFVAVHITSSGFSIECNRDAPENVAGSTLSFEITDGTDAEAFSGELSCGDEDRMIPIYDPDFFEPESVYGVSIRAKVINPESDVTTVYSSGSLDFSVKLFPVEGGIVINEISALITLPNTSLAIPPNTQDFYLVVAEVGAPCEKNSAFSASSNHVFKNSSFK